MNSERRPWDYIVLTLMLGWLFAFGLANTCLRDETACPIMCTCRLGICTLPFMFISIIVMYRKGYRIIGACGIACAYGIAVLLPSISWILLTSSS